MRIGFGYDVHRLVPGRRLIIGGVEIPYEKGLWGHSDADLLLHSIADALLGALALGDIGKHFPDTDMAYKDADSRVLLRKCYKMVQDRGYRLGNLDATISAEAPKLAPYIDAMRAVIAEDLACGLSQISIKATTEEGLGVSGMEAGMSATAVLLLLPLS